MKNRSMPIGAALMFTVLTVLMLASFASLALSSANADLALSERAEASMVEYYSLDKMAQQRLSQFEKQGKAGESLSFELSEGMSSLVVKAEMTEKGAETREYRSVAKVTADYDEELLDLWDGN